MAFIGNTNTTQAFTPAIDYFSGNGSTTAFTLSRPVASVAQVQVTIDNVAQNPSSAYTVSGSTITFTSAPLSGTNNIYVYYTSPITQVIAPGQGTVNSTSLASSTGSGAVVLATSPTLVTPALGTPSAINLSNATALPKAALPTGSVLQVVSASSSTATTTTSTSYVTTNIAVSITPTSATSKILVLHQGMINTLGTTYWCFYTLYRGGTNLYASSAYGSTGGIYINGGVDNHCPSNIVYLDSPATTSSTTYTIYVKSGNGSSVRYNPDSWLLNIVAMEIAA